MKWTFLAVEMEFVPPAPPDSVVPCFVLVLPVMILNLINYIVIFQLQVLRPIQSLMPTPTLDL
jgi:hypothetical protein